MAADTIQLEFSDGFKGKVIAPRGEILIGKQDGGLRPYNLLFGALGSCFYATFLSIAEKKKLSFDGAKLEVSGTQIEGEITTLDHVLIK